MHTFYIKSATFPINAHKRGGGGDKIHSLFAYVLNG